MRGLTSVEYDELRAQDGSCDGDAAGYDDVSTMGPDEEHLCRQLEVRGFLYDVVVCPCGWGHYEVTTLGHDAVHIADTIRTLEGGK